MFHLKFRDSSEQHGSPRLQGKLHLLFNAPFTLFANISAKSSFSETEELSVYWMKLSQLCTLVFIPAFASWRQLNQTGSFTGKRNSSVLVCHLTYAWNFEEFPDCQVQICCKTISQPFSLIHPPHSNIWQYLHVLQLTLGIHLCQNINLVLKQNPHLTYVVKSYSVCKLVNSLRMRKDFPVQ